MGGFFDGGRERERDLEIPRLDNVLPRTGSL